MSESPQDSTSKSESILEETKIGEIYRWAPKDIEKPRYLLPAEKIAKEKIQTGLAEKAEVRDKKCWSYMCPNDAYVWVREVGFDFKGEKAELGKHTAISSADYNGPVPGFCNFHVGTGPQLLAEAIYFNRPEMFWGVRPNRWFVSFTDGTKQGGMCIEIDPKQEMPKIVEEIVYGQES